jgi:hypothetical protein
MADAIKLKNLKTQNEKVPLKKNFSGTFSLFTSLIKKLYPGNRPSIP